MKSLSRTTAWTVAGVYTAALAVASLLPSGAGVLGGWDATITPTLQNALHVPAFAVLQILVILAVSSSFRVGLVRTLWTALGCCAYGTLLEFTQAAIPGRTGSLSDALLNAAGIIVGCLALALWRGAMAGQETVRWQRPANQRTDKV